MVEFYYKADVILWDYHLRDILQHATSNFLAAAIKLARKWWHHALDAYLILESTDSDSSR